MTTGNGLWPHQSRIIRSTKGKLHEGLQAIAISAPCGSGKSRVMQEIAMPCAAAGQSVTIYSPRKALTTQLIDGFKCLNAEFGVMASGFDLDNPDALIQICSVQTVASRMGKTSFCFPAARWVIVDEAHQQTGEQARSVLDRHLGHGAKLLGFTATPVNLGGIYSTLINEVTFKELRECNSHLPVECYGPDRPDLCKLKTNNNGDFSQAVDERINSVPTIIGRVFDNWKKLNPKQLPAIGFAPSVASSREFVEQFRLRGVACAHLDAERTLLTKPVNGELVTEELATTKETRQEVVRGSASGEYKVVWNRFVLREAIDMPWLYQAITATSMGGLSTYLQSVGRVLRFCNRFDHVVYQDHGGNIDRHGMPDEEGRDWKLGDTNKTMAKKEKERRQKTKGDNAEPICCPKCSAMRTHGPQCHSCGHMHKRSSRLIRELDGTLVRKVGRTVKYKRPKGFDEHYTSALYAAAYKGMTVKQAYKIAKDKATAEGIAARPSKVFVPPDGSEKWQKSVREVYPYIRPQHLQGGRRAGN